MTADKATAWHDAVERMNFDSTIAAENAFERGETMGLRQFLWEPLVACLRGARSAAPGERFGSAVLAGYGSLARVAKLWEAEQRWSDKAILTLHRGGEVYVLRREWRGVVEAILDERVEPHPIDGGRGGAYRVLTAQGPVVVRRYRRGGGMRWAGETYFGLQARPFREFTLLLRARRRGLPVPDPVAAVVERRLGFTYRGLLMMSEIVGGIPLWDFLRAEPQIDVSVSLGRNLRRLHDGGLDHPDLNLRNILVVSAAGEIRFAFVDLDRARLHREALKEGPRRRMLARVRRSARRLDPEGRFARDDWLDRLERAYWTGP